MKLKLSYLVAWVIFSGFAINTFAQDSPISKRYDLVIDEIFPDPSPQIGLPNAEFVEIKNISGRTLNLQGCKLASLSASSGSFPAYSLPPDSFLIISSTSNAVQFSAYGRALGVPSFPSLDNTAATLSIISPDGKTIHAVSYSASSYNNLLKKEGGWTLEMIDTNNPCGTTTNWNASVDDAGGTPGRKNSIDATLPDETSPGLIRTYTIGDSIVIAVFSEPIDSLSGDDPVNYTFDGGLSVTAASTMPPLYNEVKLKFNNPLQLQTIYHVTANNLTDCKTNKISVYNIARSGIAVNAEKGDMVVNEILARSKDNEYIEYYNRSNKIIDAAKLNIATRDSGGDLSSFKLLSETPFYIFPDDYVVATEDVDMLKLNYLVKDPGNVFPISSMPTLSDAQGFAILLNAQGEIIDEVAYDSKWHYELINNDEGVALERIDPSGPSQDGSNWHSASSTSGYGTPTAKNSQYKNIGAAGATISVSPSTFSPDNDGRDDIVSIQYSFSDIGNIATITIFNAVGRPVRHLVKNGITGIKGYWNWNGLDDEGAALPIGPYIIFTELFNLTGKKQQFKNVLVLAKVLK